MKNRVKHNNNHIKKQKFITGGRHAFQLESPPFIKSHMQCLDLVKDFFFSHTQQQHTYLHY